MQQARPRFKTVFLPCGHLFAVPGYQTTDLAAYPEQTRKCDKCAAGLDPNAVRVRSKAKV